MTESRHFDVQPTDAMIAAAAEDLKKLWAHGTGVFDKKDRLNEQLLAKVNDLRTLVACLLAAENLGLEQAKVLHAVLHTVHPEDPPAWEGANRTPKEIKDEQELMAWSIGVLMRVDLKYPKNSAKSIKETNRRAVIAKTIGINSVQLNEPGSKLPDPNRYLDVFRTAYINYLVDRLNDPEACDKAIAAARANMREPDTMKPATGTPVTVVDDELARVDSPDTRSNTEVVKQSPLALGRSRVGTGRKRYWRPLAVMGAVVVIVIGGTVIMVHRGAGNGDTRVLAKTSGTVPAAAPPGVSLSPNNICDDSVPAAAATTPDVGLGVVYWCLGGFHVANGVDAPPDLTQIKMRPVIQNPTLRAIDVSITQNAALRLLVETPNNPRDWWRPPQRTAKAGDHPSAVIVDDKLLWAIPPNLTNDAVQVDLLNNTRTYGFATSWDYTILNPGQTAFKPLRFKDDGTPIQEGDLVFSVPLNAVSQVRGLALVDRNDPTMLVAICDSDTWPQRSNLNSF
ncbi:hypothetical protein [Nocardia brasiliensis]